MTNADNMFYSLGYEKKGGYDNVLLVYSNGREDIYFMDNKTIEKTFDEYEPDIMNMQELKAINEKVKELRMV